MARVTKVRVGNEELDAREEEFEVAREEWNDYRLLDGGRVRIKTIVQKIFRAIDSEGNPRYNPDGDPYMVVKHRTEVVATE